MDLSATVYNALNKELVKRLLIKYFADKGFHEGMEHKKVYPPVLQDIVARIPQLANKIELNPFVEDMDINNGLITLGWNLFVLGTERMYLGESTHISLDDLLSMQQHGVRGIQNVKYSTPKQIIEFIVNVLDKKRSGDIMSAPTGTKVPMLPAMPLATGEHSGYFKRYPVY